MAKTFLVMAGGTGGHIYPALAAALALSAEGARVVWMGSRGGMEEVIAGRAGIPVHIISVGGLRGKTLQTVLFAPFKLLRSLWQSYLVYRHEKPDCVLGMGGFVAGPGGLMALLLARPLVIHEQNAVAGLTNRWLCRWAKFVLQAFPDTFDSGLVSKNKVYTVGNPVREDLLNLSAPAVRGIGNRKPSLLVLGGSRGAQVLNEVVPQALALIPDEMRPSVVHQAGEGKDQACRELYKKLGVTAEVQPFISDMANRYQRADLAICRAGALTLAELTCVGLGALLVPYPYAVDDHQTANAQYLVAAQAAVVIPQHELSIEGLQKAVSMLISVPGRLLKMAEHAARLAKPDATSMVVRFCLEASQK
jgi:UDP-N-acetylglucosamine--N-acetylmuramyl-(pentapeptide) pyrophosphoryl-undecaprenol N-acetylglucosamine transferase